MLNMLKLTMLKLYQNKLEELRKKLNWTYWPPVVNIARLVEEVGELSRAILHVENIKPKKAGEQKQNVGEEMADVIMIILWLANSLDINLDKEMKRVFEKVEKRDKNRYKNTKYS